MSILERLVEATARWCEKRGRIFKITGTGGPNDVYLIRYYVFKSKWFNVFIHRFMRSDRDDLHDHPWDFVTYLVRGAYTERKWNDKLPGTVEIRRSSGGNRLLFVRRTGNVAHLMDDRDPWYSIKPANRLVYRRAKDQHMVLTDHEYAPHEWEYAPLTVCVTGRTKRDWGFIREHKHSNGHKWREWVPWRTYLGLPPDTPGRG